MAFKTRWFGKKVEGESLKNLVSALGENPQKLLQTSGERWSTKEVHGRVGFTPTNEGVNVDLYVFRTDYHIKDGTIPADNYDSHSLYGNEILTSDIHKNELTFLSTKHIQGEIKYAPKEGNTKQGTGTGTGVFI
jgi:hypothetical protein